MSPAVSVARTVIDRDDAASKSSAPFTTRFPPEIANRLPGLLSSE